MSRPRVLVLADVETWAWHRKALAYRQHLSEEFDVTVAYHAKVPSMHDFDLVHLFEVSQIGIASAFMPRQFKLVAGLTANVWRTWGAERMLAWGARVDGLHANSILLLKEIEPFHPRLFYTPNGVDVDFWKRTWKSDRPIIFGHVGKPNPRKGADLITEASRLANVRCHMIRRTAKLAISAEEMLAWYQGIAVQVTASNMDGTPNPMLEAAACECAMLSTPIGNMPEFIDNGLNGYLTMESLPYHDPHETVTGERMAEDNLHITRLRDELVGRMHWMQHHPDETLAMGRAARQTILNGWTWKQQTEHVARMWREMLNSR